MRPLTTIRKQEEQVLQTKRDETAAGLKSLISRKKSEAMLNRGCGISSCGLKLARNFKLFFQTLQTGARPPPGNTRQ